MQHIENMAEAETRLTPFYANTPQNYTLTTMRRLVGYLGNPQETFRTIHVAGTSGKTSTAYYAAALLRAAGYHTGLTVSPHVDSLTERLQIDGQPVSEAKFCAALAEFLAIIEGSQLKPSWFEVMIAFAYWYFGRQGVDYAVVEVGLGGLKDATNVIRRPDKMCIITDIGLDHTQILGTTLAAIAAQKAGIIQPENAVFVYQQSSEIMKVITQIAKRQKADVHIMKASSENKLKTLPLFQRHNFHLAEGTINFIVDRDKKAKLSGVQINQAAQTYIPGRMEAVKVQGKVVILDGAHNAQKLAALIESLHAKYPQKRVAVLAAFGDGDQARLDSALKVLATVTDHVIVTSFLTAKDFMKQSVDPQLVAEAAKKYGLMVEIAAEPTQAFSALLARPEPILLVTGSFYLLNHIRPLMLGAA